MDQAPADNEQRNIIDKLAQFVARNGPEFEQMTKNKQRDNPKFGFLFGGEHYHYYTYKVNAEQAILRQRSSSFEAQGYGGGGQDRGYGNSGWSSGSSSSGGGGAPSQTHGHQWSSSDMGGAQMARPSPSPQRQQQPRPLMDIQPFGPTPVTATSSSPSSSMLPAQKLSELRSELSRLSQEQQTLRDQIAQSEQNLSAQRTVSLQQENSLSVEAVRRAKWDRLEVLANDTGVDLDEMETVMHPIVESCSKDSISSGKIWIFQKAVSHETNKLIAHYLAYRVTREDAPFTHKLYLVYLMNDVLHHCVRKGAEELKQSLESVAVEMFCSAHLAAGDNEHQKQKLSKLIRLWEDKSIFSASTLAKMKMEEESWAAYKDQLAETYAEAIEAAVAHLRQTYNSYQQQHHNFVAHANGSIRTLEQQRIQIQQQIHASEVEAARVQQQQLQRQEEERMYQQQQHSYPQPHQIQPQSDFQQQSDDNKTLALPQPKPTRSSRWDTGAKPAAAPAAVTSEGGWPGPPTPGAFPSSFLAPPPSLIPDLSRPPPGFAMPPPMLDESALVPSLPYYDLPAGLMVSMVKMEDSGYKPLDPKKIRLPPPAPPSDRLLQALEMFYSPPSHDRPRDPEGWELTGLYEWTRDKLAAVAVKAEDVRLGRRDRSPTASPEPYSNSSRASTPEKVSKASEETAPPPKVPERKRYRSRSRTRSRSRGSTPDRGRRSRSQSPEGDYALPSYLTKRSPSPSGRRPTRPPRPDQDEEDAAEAGSRAGFGAAASAGGAAVPLDASNKGHQMMQRMGWRGSGLGSAETGIVEPVSGGEVRDKQDMYRGVGLGSDPFDAFRKAKSGSFYTRMKDRDGVKK